MADWVPILPVSNRFSPPGIQAKLLKFLDSKKLRRLGGEREIPVDTRIIAASNRDLERMVAQAQSMGANAVVNVRFATSSVAQGAAELFAYGTAVKVQ